MTARGWPYNPESDINWTDKKCNGTEKDQYKDLSKKHVAYLKEENAKMKSKLDK